MRILLFGPYPAPGQPLAGGLMAVVHDLAQGLGRRPGLEVAVAAAHVQAAENIEQDGPVKIYRLKVPRYTRLRWQRPLRRSLLAAAEDFQPTLVHAHSTHYYAAAALDGVWPRVITAHGVVRHEAALNDAGSLKERLAWPYDALFEARVLQRARACIAITPYIRQAFARYSHIHWYDIENPVDDACFAIERRPEAGRLLTAARVIPRKGIDALIEALAETAARFPQARLHIAGETASAPEYAAACRRRVEALGLADRVVFLGALQRADLLAEYAQAAGFILAGRQETAPVVVSEALAAGCPVIATAVGGVPHQIEHETTGLLIPPQQPDALAAAMTRLLSHPDEAAVWGQAARRAAHRYRLEAVIDKHLTVYDDVLNAGG